MVLAAPELIEAERIDLLDEIEVAAELQHRMLADRMMRGEEGSEFEACHEFLSGRLLLLIGLLRRLRAGKLQGNRPTGIAAHAHAAMRAAGGAVRCRVRGARTARLKRLMASVCSAS
jgi:hypothetical protein